MKKQLMLSATLAAASLSSNVVSAGNTTAQIDRILVADSTSMVYVYPVGGVQNPPSCHGSNGDYYSFKTTRSLAKEYYSGLLAAMMSGSVVTFWGSNACTDQPQSETLNYFRINRP